MAKQNLQFTMPGRDEDYVENSPGNSDAEMDVDYENGPSRISAKDKGKGRVGARDKGKKLAGKKEVRHGLPRGEIHRNLIIVGNLGVFMGRIIHEVLGCRPRGR